MKKIIDEIKQEGEILYEQQFTSDELKFEQKDNLMRFDVSAEILQMLGIDRDSGIQIEAFQFPGTSIVDVSIKEK